MGILKDINKIAQTVGEARKVTKFVTELAEWKKQVEILKQERDQERKRRQELEEAIREHQKAMSDCPREWESDQKLWNTVKR